MHLADLTNQRKQQLENGTELRGASASAECGTVLIMQLCPVSLRGVCVCVCVDCGGRSLQSAPGIPSLHAVSFD